MKTKGFTLVELLGVVVIITVIFVLVAPAVTNTVSQSRETVYQKQINTILNAAYDFTLEHLNYLPETDNYKFVTIGQLKYEGLIDVNIKNSDTGEAFSDDLVISIKKVGPNQVSNNLSMLRGNYLYTVETDKPTNTNNSPIITLSTEGLKTLTKNSTIYFRAANAVSIIEAISKAATSATIRFLLAK